MNPDVVVKRREISNKNKSLSDKLHPVLKRVYLARGVAGDGDLRYRVDALLPPKGLGGLDAAAELLAEAVSTDQRILIVGDYDADGATGTALAVEVLRALGARRVDYRVPDRFRFGYGLSPELVASLGPRPADLIITVDNGIASLRGVAAAREAGARVLITDHHVPGPALPPADAIVNPNLDGDAFPSKHLAGVGVMFYVLAAVRARLTAHGWFGRTRRAPRLADWLDLVAVGTVADLVRLDLNNRVLVAQGLKRIRARRCRPGIAALLEVAGRDAGRTNAADLGYAVAPRLNAAGRLSDMRLGIDCLLESSPERARVAAARLDDLNRQRQALQGEMQEQAEAIVAGLATGAERQDRRSLTLFEPDWHQGVVGLIAARLKDRYHLPVIAFAPAAPGADELKGSARSIAGFHIRDALAAVEARAPDLIGRYGGHAMAAGLSLERERLDEFCDAFEAVAAERLDPETLGKVVLTDGGLAPAEITLELADSLARAGPWGQGFPEPLFDDFFAIEELRPVGTEHVRLLVTHERGGAAVEAIAFRRRAEDFEGARERIRLLYHLTVNEYRGRRSPQLLVRHVL